MRRYWTLAALSLVYAVVGCATHNPAGIVPSARAPSQRHRSASPHYRIVDLGADFNPSRINNVNVVVGGVRSAATMYSAGSVTMLPGYPSDASAFANDINDGGEIVGVSQRRSTIMERSSDTGSRHIRQMSALRRWLFRPHAAPKWSTVSTR